MGMTWVRHRYDIFATWMRHRCDMGATKMLSHSKPYKAATKSQIGLKLTLVVTQPSANGKRPPIKIKECPNSCPFQLGFKLAYFNWYRQAPKFNTRGSFYCSYRLYLGYIDTHFFITTFKYSTDQPELLQTPTNLLSNSYC